MTARSTYTPYPPELVRLKDRREEAERCFSWKSYQLREWLQKVHDGPLLHPGEHPFKKWSK